MFGFTAILLITPTILVSLLNNIAIREIVSEWPKIQPENGVIKCEHILDASRSEPFIHYASILFSSNIKTKINTGRIAWLKGDCNQAKESWEIILNSPTMDQSILFWLFWLSGFEDKDFIISHVGDEKFANIVSSLATKANQTSNPISAISLYEISYEIHPKYSIALSLINLYKQQNQLDKTEALLIDVIGMMKPESVEFYWITGQLAELKYDWEAALEAYTKGALIADDPFDFYIRQAISLERLGNWAQVEEAYRNAKEVRPDHILGYLGLGNIQRHNGKYSEALYWYEKAESLEPGNYSILFNIGEMYFEQNLLSQAEVYFSKAISINPDHDLSNYYLARIYNNFGDHDRAISTLVKANKVSTYPQGDWLVLLGDWQWESGDLRNALASYHSAKRIHPEDSTIQVRIVNLIKIMRQNERLR